MTKAQIDNVFVYHAPKGDQVERYAALREGARQFALQLQDMVPESREKSLALTHLQEVMMWANAGIAINE